MRASQFFMVTMKETPAEAEVISHQLMLRAGMIRRLSTGLYSWLPLGLRVLRKVEQIVREEMERSGVQEILMPMVQPAEIWQQSGRWQQYGPELLRFKDRHQRDFCLGPTHEEVITDLLKHEINSYRQLPLAFYQIQTKFRDEIRPRFGVMRAREFIMKDAYSFHLDLPSLQQTYQVMYDTYQRIFTRLGLNFRAVLADNGSIGGESSHEFHVIAQSGEDVIVFSEKSTYAANVEKAEAFYQAKPPAAPQQKLHLVHTPNCQTVEQLAQQQNIPSTIILKTLIVKGRHTPFVALLLRGDHELNAVKAERLTEIAYPLTMVSDIELKQSLGLTRGSIGPLELPLPIIADREVASLSDFIIGANQPDHHYFGVNWQRDLALPPLADLRNVVSGDLAPDGQSELKFARGIEVGHIFQLGTKYSQAMNFNVTNEQGEAQPLLMGCYGIGISRIVAAAIEQNHDEAGIIWTEALAPFQIAIVLLNNTEKSQFSEITQYITTLLETAKIEYLIDDRDLRPGHKFADLELIGIPHRLVISERNLKNQQVEYKGRRDKNPRLLSINELANFIGQLFSIKFD